MGEVCTDSEEHQVEQRLDEVVGDYGLDEQLVDMPRCRSGDQQDEV